MNNKIDINFKTAEGSQADALVKKHLGRVVERIVQEIEEENLVSLLITGSVSHGEGAVSLWNDRYFVLSDYDFIVVLKRITPQLKKRLYWLAQDVTKELIKDGLLCHVDIIPNTKKSMRLGATMISTDIYHNAKALLGEDIKKLMKEPSVREITKDDARRIIFNRIGAQLQLRLLAVEQGVDNLVVRFLYAYHTAKTFLDALGSILAFNGDYQSDYQMRYAKSEGIKLLDGYRNELELAQNLKINGDIQAIVDEYKDIRSYWVKSQILLTEVLRHELGLGEDDSLSDYLVNGLHEKRSPKHLLKNGFRLLKLMLHKPSRILSLKIFIDNVPVLTKVQTALAICFLIAPTSSDSEIDANSYQLAVGLLGLPKGKQEVSEQDWLNACRQGIDLWREMIGHFDWMEMVVLYSPLGENH